MYLIVVNDFSDFDATASIVEVLLSSDVIGTEYAAEIATGTSCHVVGVTICKLLF